MKSIPAYVAILMLLITGCSKSSPNDVPPAAVPTVPVLTGNATTSSLTATTIVISSSIVSDGGSAITARGVCWGTAANPSVTGNHTIDGSGTGTFNSTITGLNPQTV